MATSMPQRIHLERHAAERGHRIDHEQRGMAAGADRLADRLDVVDGARGGVDLRHHDRLDAVIPVLAQPGFDLGRPHRAAPVAVQHLDIGAHRGGSVAPVDGKAPALQHQHLVAARQHIADGGFPGAMTIGDVDVAMAGGGKQPAEIAQQAVGQLHHLVGIDVERRTMHRLQHFVGHCGGTGDREKFPAGANDHGCCSLLVDGHAGMAGCEIKAHRGHARNWEGKAIVGSRGSRRLRPRRPNRTSACPC